MLTNGNYHTEAKWRIHASAKWVIIGLRDNISPVSRRSVYSAIADVLPIMYSKANSKAIWVKISNISSAKIFFIYQPFCPCLKVLNAKQLQTALFANYDMNSFLLFHSWHWRPLSVKEPQITDQSTDCTTAMQVNWHQRKRLSPASLSRYEENLPVTGGSQPHHHHKGLVTRKTIPRHRYSDVIMTAMTSQITGIPIVCSTVCSGAYQGKYQSSAWLAFVKGIHRSPVDSPHKGPVTRKMLLFDDVIMSSLLLVKIYNFGKYVRLSVFLLVCPFCQA